MSHFVTNTKQIPLLNNEIINGLEWAFLPWGRIGSWPHLEHTGASAIHIHGFMECFVCVSGRLLVSVVKTHVLSSFYPFLDDKKVGSIKSGSFWLFFRVCWMLNHDYGNHSLSKKQFSTTDKNVTTQIPYSNKIEPRDSTLQNITSKVPTQSDFGDIMRSRNAWHYVDGNFQM